MATRGRKGDPIRYRQTKSGPRWDVFYREGRWIIPYVGAMSLRDFGPEQVAG